MFKFLTTVVAKDNKIEVLKVEKSKKEKYLELRDLIVSCKKCRLREKATQVVPGAGSINAKIMFIGEGPGEKEDKLGVPFVGSAGKFLDVLLESIQLKRTDVFIANMVKCRPPQNRDPFPDEIECCRTWLDMQINIINPVVFIPLGRHAMSKFLPGRIISKEHGNAYLSNGKTIFLSYHPAVALYNGSFREVMLNDFKKLREILDGKIIPKTLNISETVENIVKLKKEKIKPDITVIKNRLFSK